MVILKEQKKELTNLELKELVFNLQKELLKELFQLLLQQMQL